MKKVAKGTVTLAERGPLTAKERKSLMKLEKLPNSAIDLSDIPEIKSLPPGYVLGKFYRPRKTSLTMRLDADVVAWLRATGEGYQTRVNAYLRQLMRRATKHTSV